MTEIRTTHTADLDTTALDAIRALLRDAFDDLEEADVEHALGGLHATAWDGGQLVAHASVIQRRLLYQGTALRTGYVEGVAVHPGRRREGLGGSEEGRGGGRGPRRSGSSAVRTTSARSAPPTRPSRSTRPAAGSSGKESRSR